MNDATDPDPLIQTRNLLMSFVISRAMQVAAELGVADALAGGPQDCEALARNVGAHPGTLRRLMRTLVSYGVFDALADGRFANTRCSEYLRTDVKSSLRGLARMYASPAMWYAWTGLEHSVRSGEPSFQHIHRSPLFDYLAEHPEEARRFDDAMVSASGAMNEALVEAYEWNRFGTLVDVAGGVGSTLAAILLANAQLQGVLFDLPHVIDRARDYLIEQGVATRCQLLSGTFFDSIPAGADAYFMKHIIHDWGDDDCLRILRNVKAAMSDDAKLLVCEKIVPAGNERSHAKTMDLVMLALTDGGRERTEREFSALFDRASLRLARIVPTKSDNSILEVTK